MKEKAVDEAEHFSLVSLDLFDLSNGKKVLLLFFLLDLHLIFASKLAQVSEGPV